MMHLLPLPAPGAGSDVRPHAGTGLPAPSVADQPLQATLS
jgi:hypothetical protein